MYVNYYKIKKSYISTKYNTKI